MLRTPDRRSFLAAASIFALGAPVTALAADAYAALPVYEEGRLRG